MTLRLTQIKPSKHSKISVDPSITKVAYCLYQPHPKRIITIKSFGFVHGLSSNELDEDRVSYLLQRMSKLCSDNEINEAVIEKPPLTVYNQGRSSKRTMASRAQSIFKTYAVAVGLYYRLKTDGINVSMVQPSQWQVPPKKRRGLDSKQWSLLHAAQLVEMCMPGYHPIDDDVHDDNLADAINIGYMHEKKK